MKSSLHHLILILLCFVQFSAFAQNDSLIAEVEVTKTRGLSKDNSSTAVVDASAAIEKGDASYYADKFEGRLTSSGEIFSSTELTAAHNTLPFGTMVKVTNLSTNLSVVVKINDRGPFKPGRVIDLSRTAADKIGLVKTGTAPVKVEILKEKAAIVPQKATAANTIKTAENKVPVGLFSVQSQSDVAKGFGIQIGSYNDFKTMFHAIESLNKKGITNVLIHSGFVGDTPVYRLVVGPFAVKADADAELIRVQTLGEEGLVLTLANLK